MCLYQGAHVFVCKKYIKIVDKYINILLINIRWHLKKRKIKLKLI